MKNKPEQKLDAELEQRLRVNIRIYHFRKDVGPYTSITIVTNSVTSKNRMREILMILRKLEIYGVSICDRRDTFNRQRGRIIAKGRLLKHFKDMTKWQGKY
jgi:hypothetical protein